MRKLATFQTKKAQIHQSNNCTVNRDSISRAERVGQSDCLHRHILELHAFSGCRNIEVPYAVLPNAIGHSTLYFLSTFIMTPLSKEKRSSIYVAIKAFDENIKSKEEKKKESPFDG